MGQVALGLRSLLVKLVIFFVMAALLAWALGGTLWPRTEVVSFPGVTFQGQHWYWEMLVGGPQRGQVRWRLMAIDGAEGEAKPRPVDGRHWAEVAPRLVVSGEWLYYAGRATTNPDEPWRIERTGDAAAARPKEYVMPDRLAVEQQLARITSGLEVQDVEIIRAQRGIVIDPPVEARGP